MPTWENKPAQGHTPVTPSDAAIFSPPFRMLFIGGAGTITVVSMAGNSATYSVIAGYLLQVAGVRVMATGTTATGIVALY